MRDSGSLPDAFALCMVGFPGVLGRRSWQRLLMSVQSAAGLEALEVGEGMGPLT